MGNYFEPLRTFENHCMETINNIKKLWNDGNYFEPPKTFMNHRKSLRTTGNHWEPLETTENHWKPLRILKKLWEPLAGIFFPHTGRNLLLHALLKDLLFMGKTRMWREDLAQHNTPVYSRNWELIGMSL